MLWLLIAIAAFNLVVSLVMIVRDKRDDVAILMTLGANANTVQAIFLWQGAVIALLGITAGVGLGLLGALWVGEIAAAFEVLTGVVLLNPEIYPIDFLPSQILASDIAGIAAGVLLLSVLASFYPARQAAALRPCVSPSRRLVRSVYFGRNSPTGDCYTKVKSHCKGGACDFFSRHFALAYPL